MAEKRILCGFGIDLDAVGGWLGSYGGEDSPDDISRGLFAGEVRTPPTTFPGAFSPERSGHPVC
jgi:hypothetical protein